MRSQKGVALILIVVGLLLLLLGMGVALSVLRSKIPVPRNPLRPTTTAQCTLDAKLCPNGSSVGRTGPHCEFAPCPSQPLKRTYQIGTLTFESSGKMQFEKLYDKVTGITTYIYQSDECDSTRYDCLPMITLGVQHLPNTLLADELKKIALAEYPNKQESIAIAKAPKFAKGIISGKHIQVTINASNWQAVFISALFQYEKDVYHFWLTDYTQSQEGIYNTILESFTFDDTTTDMTGRVCDYFAPPEVDTKCPTGYVCQGNRGNDAGGVCVKQ